MPPGVPNPSQASSATPAASMPNPKRTPRCASCVPPGIGRSRPVPCIELAIERVVQEHAGHVAERQREHQRQAAARRRRAAREHDAGQRVRPDRRQVRDAAQRQCDAPLQASSPCTHSSSRAMASSSGRSRYSRRQHGPRVRLDLEVRRTVALALQVQRPRARTPAWTRTVRALSRNTGTWKCTRHSQPPSRQPAEASASSRSLYRRSAPPRALDDLVQVHGILEAHAVPRRTRRVTRGMRSPAVTWILAIAMPAPSSASTHVRPPPRTRPRRGTGRGRHRGDRAALARRGHDRGRSARRVAPPLPYECRWSRKNATVSSTVSSKQQGSGSSASTMRRPVPRSSATRCAA